MDPVQHDEAHAADHDHETAQQEGGGLERRKKTHLANMFILSDIKEELDNLGNTLICIFAKSKKRKIYIIL